MFKLLCGAEFDITVEIAGYDGQKMNGRISYESDTKNVFDVFDKDERLIANVTVEAENKDSSACLSVLGEFVEGEVYDIRRAFAAFDSIRLNLVPKFKANRVMGNYYFIEDKSDCWAGAFFADDIINAPRRIASMLWQKDALYYNLLPLCDGDFKSEIHANGKGLEITIAPHTGGFRKIVAKAVVITSDTSPYDVIEKNIESGFSFLGKKRMMQKDAGLPEMFDYLGWCSWDSCRYDVTDQKIYDKMAEFNEKKVPVKWVLVDDGWYQERPGRLLWDIKEEKEKFPDGIKKFVLKVKENYGVNHIGFWQCFTGGWSGLHPDSPLLSKYPETLLKTNYGEILPAQDAGGSFDFWNRWDKYLADSGVDFVKVDVQSNVEACTHGNMSVGQAVSGSYAGMEGAAGIHFGGAVINCTAMGHECLWNKRKNILNRNSWDFDFNNVGSMRTFSVDNVYNSMYHSHFCHSDWDMMHTHGGTARINTVLHAVSGAPVYLSDIHGETVPEIAKAFADSSGKLYKCDRYAMPTPDRIFTDPRKEDVLLKFQSCAKGSGIIGAVNVNECDREIADFISAEDVVGLDGEKFILLNHFENSFEKISRKEKKKISISPFGAEIYQFTPIEDGFAFIGFADKYVSAAAVESKENFGNRIIIKLREGGMFTYYSECEHSVRVNGVLVSVNKNGIINTIEIEDGKNVLVEIEKGL